MVDGDVVDFTQILFDLHLIEGLRVIAVDDGVARALV